MAFNLKMFVVLCAFFVTAHCQDCSCMDDKTKKDLEDFRNFLLKLPEDHDYVKYPVVPGELSPLVCNCIPKERRKRKIVETQSPQSLQYRHVRLPRKPAPRRRTYNLRNKCAYGDRWIPVLNVCVKSDFTLRK